MTAQRQERKAQRRGVALIVAVTTLLGPLGLPFAARANVTERVVADRYTGVAIGGYDPVA